MAVTGGLVLEHTYDAPEQIIYRDHDEVDQLWRTLEGFVQDKPFTQAPEIRKAPPIELELTISQSPGPKNTSFLTRKFSLKDQILTHQLETGLEGTPKTAKIKMNDWQSGHLLHFLESHGDSLPDDGKVEHKLGTAINPVIYMGLACRYSDAVINFEIEEGRSRLLEFLPGIIIELLQKQLLENLDNLTGFTTVNYPLTTSDLHSPLRIPIFEATKNQ